MCIGKVFEWTMATEYINEQFLAPASSNEARQQPVSNPVGDRPAPAVRLEDAIARLEASLPDEPIFIQPAKAAAQPKPSQPKAQPAALARPASRSRLTPEQLKAQAEQLKAMSQQLQVKAAAMLNEDAALLAESKAHPARPTKPALASKPQPPITQAPQSPPSAESQKVSTPEPLPAPLPEPLAKAPPQAEAPQPAEPAARVPETFKPVQKKPATLPNGKSMFERALLEKAAIKPQPRPVISDKAPAPAPYRKPEPATPVEIPELADLKTSPKSIFNRFDRLAVEQMLAAMYPNVQFHDLLPSQLWQGPLIPDFMVRSINTQAIKRVVIIGCGDGRLANTLSLLFPEIEVIGIDTNQALVDRAQETVGRRTNIKFIHGNPVNMTEIPCDRIIYNHCLAGLKDRDAYKALIKKTVSWIGPNGDFMIQESPLKLALNAGFLKNAYARLREVPSIEYFVRRALKDVGFANPLTYRFQKLPFFATEVCFQYPKTLNLTGMLPRPRAHEVKEWQDWGGQSMDSVVGFLFADQKADFRPDFAR